MKLLTKTDFISYRECAKNVWIKWHQPEVYAKYPKSEFEQALGKLGDDVEKLAREYFTASTKGYLIERHEEGAQALTKKLMTEKVPLIFQGVFATEHYLAATDVLKWNAETGLYDMYEIKMSSSYNAETGSFEDEVFGDDDESNEAHPKEKKVNKKKELQYEYDIAFQINVIEACGVRIGRAYLMRLDKEYVRIGALDLEKLFTIEDKTEKVEALKEMALGEMKIAYTYLSALALPEGSCDCYYRGRSRHCTTFPAHTPHVPDYSVHDINRIGNSAAYLRELLSEGVLDMADVPRDSRLMPKKVKGKVSLPRKLNQVTVHQSKEPIVDLQGIKNELEKISFPIYFLDYETSPTPIPRFSLYRPYQQIVFQYSLHVLKSAESELEHYEELIFDGDPSERIAESLASHIGDRGTIVVWFKRFENGRNHELARLVPSHKVFLESVIARTYDLMDIVDQQHYVHQDFKGKSSIKNVLPVLVPALSYENLAVKNGMDAMEGYRQIVHGELQGAELEQKKKDMLLYCERDSIAMYEIWKFFSILTNNGG